MGWNTLLPNQCISFNNLQDGCNLGLFLYTQPIPVSTQQITKQDFEEYILVPASVTNYPPFANKPQNQLVVKDFFLKKPNVKYPLNAPSLIYLKDNSIIHSLKFCN